MQNKKSNLTFKYMKAILILMVIDDHVSSQVGFLSSIFPYNSFYMPLFVCASGYFFKNNSLVTNMKKLTINILIPYIIWSFIGNFVSMILATLNISNWYRTYDFASWLQLFTFGTFSTITDAGWFAIMLLWVRALYVFLRKILIEKLWVDYLLLFVLALISIVSVNACMSGYADNVYKIFLFRLLFYFFFYHIGYMFSKYWEIIIKKYNKVFVCTFTIILNIILISIWGTKINYYSTKYMQSFNSIILPYVTFITGSLFWYEICSVMAEKIGDNKYVDFISRNTFTIMMSHLFFTNIPNYFIMYNLMYNNVLLDDFDYVSFYNSATIVRYNTTTKILGFLFAVVGCCLLCKMIEMVKQQCNQLVRKKNV